MQIVFAKKYFTGLWLLGVILAGSQMATAEQIDVWLGTSGHPKSEGIYYSRLDTETGKLEESTLAAKIQGPGFLAMHPSKPMLYAVGTLEGTPSVVAYKIVEAGGRPRLQLDSAAAIGDGGAAHVSVARNGKFLLTAQYGGGSTGVFSLTDSGGVADRTQLLEHEGGSRVDPNRQSEPHAHWTGFSPDGKFAFVPDLGLDAVVIYKVGSETGDLVPHGTGVCPPGGGPRHMKFHPNGRWIYVLNELELSVSLFDYDSEAGTMTRRATTPTVPKDELDKEQFTSCSEIRVHPSGKFVYAANRGHDTITVFKVDEESGELAVVELVNVRGATPRNFNLSPDAQWLLAGGQDSHTLASFAVDGSSGELTYNRSIINTPAPICVLFQAED